MNQDKKQLAEKRDKLGKKNSEKVQIGDEITFSRKGTDNLSGTVIIKREETVIVTISEVVKNLLGLETNRTVVSHKNYKINKSK